MGLFPLSSESRWVVWLEGRPLGTASVRGSRARGVDLMPCLWRPDGETAEMEGQIRNTQAHDPTACAGMGIFGRKQNKTVKALQQK